PPPRTTGHFAEGRHDAHGQAGRLGDHLPRRPGPLERARIARGDRGAGQRARNGRTLVPPRRGERNVPRAGKPPLPDPFRLPMPYYEKPQPSHTPAILSRFPEPSRPAKETGQPRRASPQLEERRIGRVGDGADACGDPRATGPAHRPATLTGRRQTVRKRKRES